MKPATFDELEFRKELVLSTGHMPKWIAGAMSDRDDERPNADLQGLEGVCFDCVAYGYLVWVPPREIDDPNPDADKPVELHRALALARQHGCQFIRFDEDGPHIAGLPWWDW